MIYTYFIGNMLGVTPPKTKNFIFHTLDVTNVVLNPIITFISSTTLTGTTSIPV